ncbi:MAG TPA: LamG domain-containing protein [Polyangia bacterium]
MRDRPVPPIRLLGLAALLLSACGTGPIDAVGLSPGGLSQELVGHWSFDEGADSVIHDSSGKGHDGNINGSDWSWLSQGRFGGALHLEQGDFVAVDSFPNATLGWTVSAWVQIASKDVGMSLATVISAEDVFHGGWEMNLSTLPTDLYYDFGYWTGPGTFDYLAYYACKKCIHPDHWQHVAAVVDGAASTLSFYLDGVLQDRHQVPQAISPGVSTLYMGRWATTDPARLLVGSLDDIAIWSRPLVSEEIALLTQAPAP